LNDYAGWSWVELDYLHEGVSWWQLHRRWRGGGQPDPIRRGV